MDLIYRVMLGGLILLTWSPAWGQSSVTSTAKSTVLPHTNTVFQPAHYESLEAWQTRRTWLRDQVRLAAGLVPEWPRTPLNSKVFGKLVRDGYTVEKVYFESSPGIYVTGNLYRPENTPGRRPGVACPHGHWPHGRLHHDARGSIAARCITLARAGAVVFAYDMVGYNDSARAFPHRHPDLDTPETALWGIGHLPLQTLNSIRVIDFLRSLPDVDPGRIGVTGASGGGTQTFILSAVDDRVTVDCPVNMISSTMQGGCVCENAPLLRIGTNNMEIAALFAPKPRLMVSATGDWTKLTPEVEYPFVRSIYELYSAADRIANVHIDAEHNYNPQSRQAMYRFFGRWLLDAPDPDSIREGHIPVEKPEDLLVFDDANVPANLADAQETIQRMKQRVMEQAESLLPSTRERFDELTRLVRTWLEHATGGATVNGEGKSTVVHAELTEGADDLWRIDSARERNQRRVAMVSHLRKPSTAPPGPKSIIFIVDPQGLAAAERHRALTDALVEEGHNVTFIEPFGTGGNPRDPASTQPADQHKFFTTFNPTDDALTVHDILTALDPAGHQPIMPGHSRRLRLVGFGRMGPLCLLARALVSEELARTCDLRVVADMNGFDSSSDATYVNQLFIPCIRRFGGLPAIAAVAANGPLWLHNTQGHLDTTWLDAARRITNADVHVDRRPADMQELVSWLTAPSP